MVNDGKDCDEEKSKHSPEQTGSVSCGSRITFFLVEQVFASPPIEGVANEASNEYGGEYQNDGACHCGYTPSYVLKHLNDCINAAAMNG